MLSAHSGISRFTVLAMSSTSSARRATATFTLKVTTEIREDTVFVPFHWGDAQSINRLTHAAVDPVSGMPELKVCAVRAAAFVEDASVVSGFSRTGTGSGE